MSSGVESPTADLFLKSVLRSGLMNRDQLKAALRGVPKDRRTDPRALADHLVRKGKLSRFQAGKLLEGTALGLVLGPFQILAPIGRGGMGTVYLARDSRSGQLLALKILPPKKAREEERLLSRFRREMEMSQKVAHPHLAWTCEVGVCNGVYYIAMEYIPGKSLYRLVNEIGPMPVARAAALFAEIASALDHAHHQGLVHRDMKPSNVLITPHNHAKVLDLGLAIMEGEVTKDRRVTGGQGYIVGTMDYIAPEQADDASKATARSDIYALGCSLYFTLTGQPPFPGGTNKDKIRRHRTEEPAPITSVSPAIPAGFAAIVHKMISKKPEERFASAAEVREELLKWVSGEPVLPLDKPEDTDFHDAVVTLETAEPDPELLEDENIAAVEPAPGDRPLSASTINLQKLFGDDQSLGPVYLALLGLGLILLGGTGLVALYIALHK
jgi:serine/threonine protein kinase